MRAITYTMFYCYYLKDSDEECCCSPSPAGADMGVWAAGSQQEHHCLCLALHHLQLPAGVLRERAEVKVKCFLTVVVHTFSPISIHRVSLFLYYMF